MLGIQYFKAEPTEFARMRVGGSVRKEGEGISGFYIPLRTTIEMVSLTSKDSPISFPEISKDNQEVNLQGGFLYIISNPKVTMGRYNLSIDPSTKQYQTDDIRKLPEHMVQLIRGEARRIVQATPLEELLHMGEDLASRVTESLTRNDLVAQFGIDLKAIYFESVRPKPEIAKALEADYRESLLQRADEAIYARRAQAVEKERTIQENEMRTKIEMEEKRKKLVELEGTNIVELAGYKAQATRKELEAYNNIGADMVTAQALLRIGENAGSIDHLTITPDVLAGIMNQSRVPR